jgi:hypothetical protein
VTAPARFDAASALPSGFKADFRAPYEPKVSPELVEEIKGSPERIKQHLREQCKTDRFFLASGILGYQDVNPYTHGPFISWLEDRTLKRRMGLMHRGSLKSTLGTIVDEVGNALADPEEHRGLIVNEIEENAIGFLSEIKAHFENNELLHELFPELIPKRFGGPGSRWSTHKACLPRKTAYKEWTWQAVGVGSAIVSRHYTHIKFDDVIGFEARQSPAAMKYAIAYVKSIESQLVNMDEDLVDWIGTRWAIYDVYREVLNLYGEDISYFAREDIERVPEDASDDLLLAAGFKGDLDKLRGTLQPIFPRKFSLKALHRLSVIDPVLYYAQYKNNPIADGIKDFNADKIRWFDFDSSGNVVYRDSKTGILRRWTRESLDVVMACDPNSGELTATDLPSIVVAAFSPEDQVFVFDNWARRCAPDTFVERIYDMWDTWRPRVVGIEKAGQQTTNFYFKKLAHERKIYIQVEELKPKNRPKPERIRKGLQPIINQGNLYLLKRNSQALQHQIRFHPDLNNDDDIDALEYTTEIARRPGSLQDSEDEKEAVRKVMASRSPITGYGR